MSQPETAVFLTNKSGNEVLVTRSIYDQRPNDFTPRTIKHVGTGDPKKICLLLNLEGMGSDIHAMPAISQKIKEGFEVTVFCREFSQSCFLSLGCGLVNHFDGEEKLIADPTIIIQRLLQDGVYGAVYNLYNWSQEHEFWHGLNTGISRFQQFPDLIETTLPDEFNWCELLLPYESHFCDRTKDKILIAPNSSSALRRFNKGEELATLLGGEILNPNYDSFKGLCLDIYNAKAVIAVDSGILALSCALGTPSFGLMTEASDGDSVYQYKKYLPEAKREAIHLSGEHPDSLSEFIKFSLNK